MAVATEAGTPPPARVDIGVMLEVPALVWQLPALLDRVDFVSVGSNDLVQFLFASDRGDPRMADRYDVLSPPVLSLLLQVVEECGRCNVPLSICGEIAGRPLDAMALVALGFRSLSMAASAIGPVKEMVRSLDVGAAAAELDSMLDRPDHSLRAELRTYAETHGIVL